MEKKLALKMKAHIEIEEILSFEDMVKHIEDGWKVKAFIDEGENGEVGYMTLNRDNNGNVVSATLRYDDGISCDIIKPDYEHFDEWEIYAFKKSQETMNNHLFKSVAMVSFVNRIAGEPLY